MGGCLALGGGEELGMPAHGYRASFQGDGNVRTPLVGMAAAVYTCTNITENSGLPTGGLQATSTQVYVQTPRTKVQGSLCPTAMNICPLPLPHL